MITTSRKITEHFHSTEFRCKHCGEIYIDKNLVEKMEHIFDKLNAGKCIISSGHRCYDYDIKIGGFAGRHYEGLAADCVYYDKNGKIIPAKYVICAAFDLHELNGIANIDGNYVHLDNRKNGTYYGDETRGNSSYWDDPYAYFGVPKNSSSSLKTNEEIASEVIQGKWGNGEDRKKRLSDAGYNYNDIQSIVNNRLDIDDKGLLKLAKNTIRGDYGNGEERKRRLGSRYNEVQKLVNELLSKGD